MMRQKTINKQIMAIALISSFKYNVLYMCVHGLFLTQKFHNSKLCESNIVEVWILLQILPRSSFSLQQKRKSGKTTI